MAIRTRDHDTVTRPAWPGGHDPDTVEREGSIDLTDERDRTVAAPAVREDHRDDRVADEHLERRPRPGIGYTLRVMLATLLLAAIVIAAAVNTADVEIDYVSDTVTSPLWAVIAASAGAGLLLGWLTPRPRRRRLR